MVVKKWRRTKIYGSRSPAAVFYHSSPVCELSKLTSLCGLGEDFCSEPRVSFLPHNNILLQFTRRRHCGRLYAYIIICVYSIMHEPRRHPCEISISINATIYFDIIRRVLLYTSRNDLTVDRIMSYYANGKVSENIIMIVRRADFLLQQLRTFRVFGAPSSAADRRCSHSR